MTFRHAICNEAFAGWPFAAACRAIRKAGYTGIEIAPFTLSDDPVRIPAAARRELRDTMSSEGLGFAGLHWLMVAPKGLHLTTPDAALRQRSWAHMRGLVDLCADLGPGGVMVLGSPAQRGTTGGLTREEATRHLVEGLADLGPFAAERGVTVLLEALPASQCDVVQTLDEAAAMGPTLFDIHNAVDEREPHAALVERHFEAICHVHLNELDGRHCGTGGYDYKPVLEVLARRGYTGWLSLESFDFTPGPERIAEESLRHIEAVIAEL